LRKQTPKPVFDISKSVIGYRQSLLRGLEKVKGEWNLATMSWNIKRMFATQPRSGHIAAARLTCIGPRQHNHMPDIRSCPLSQSCQPDRPVGHQSKARLNS
jgi:Transposase DDE domain